MTRISGSSPQPHPLHPRLAIFSQSAEKHSNSLIENAQELKTLEKYASTSDTIVAMATYTAHGLESLLQKVGLEVPVPAFPGADTLHNPQDIFRAYLAETVRKLVDCDRLVAYDAIQPSNVTGMGDLVVITPRLKLKGTKPNELVTKIALKLPNEPPFACPIADGIHLRVLSSPKTLPRLVLPYINDRKASYGYSVPGGGVASDGPRQKIVVEFSSPNMASEFQTSHLRSTIVGAFVSNIHEAFGWDVVRMNYLGDWGKQIGLLAAGWQRFGSEDEFAWQPARHLLEVNHKIEELFEPEKQASKQAKQDHKGTSDIESQGLFAERDIFFKRMEDQDPEAIALWRRFRDATVNYYSKSYERLGITFDEYSGESTVTTESVAEVETALKDRGVYEESDGSWIIDFAKYDARSLAVAMMRYRNGTTSYLLRDVAAVLDRYRAHSFDKMIYVVGEQEMHFNRVIKTLELMDKQDLVKRLQHVQCGKVNGLVDQLKQAHLLDDYTDACRTLVSTEMVSEDEENNFVPRSEENMQNLGLSGLFVQDLNHKRTTAYSCDTKRMTAFDGDTGVAFQNCYARLVSVMKDQLIELDYNALDFSKLETEDYTELLRIMAQYPDAVAASFKSLEPSLITSYIGRLVEQLMITLDDDQMQDWSKQPETVEARMALYGNAKQVLGNALKVLGLTPIGF